MRFHTLRDLDLQGKKVLLRADLNVPRQDGRVTDTTRIDRLKPTIDYLKSHNAIVIVLSHFGRPEGEHNPQMSLAFLVEPLKTQWDTELKFAQDCIGEKASRVIDAAQPGEVILLENVRFHTGEEKNDPAFIKELAALGDIFVHDAFSAAHRAHATTEGLAHILPSAAGLLMEAELNALDQALGNPQKPVAAIAGGSKISTKLSVLKNLSARVDFLILGGGMANTFLFAKGIDVGNSLCEKDMVDEAKDILAYAESNGCEILLPKDLVVVTELQPGGEFDVVSADAIPSDKMAIDAGPDSVKFFSEKIATCKTVVWNGPLGVFEIKPFDNGTNALAKSVADLTKSGSVTSIAGGGDTVAALENAGVSEDFSYISTAGGAFLEWLEGKTLPGVAALEKSAELKAANA